VRYHCVVPNSVDDPISPVTLGDFSEFGFSGVSHGSSFGS